MGSSATPAARYSHSAYSDFGRQNPTSGSSKIPNLRSASRAFFVSLMGFHFAANAQSRKPQIQEVQRWRMACHGARSKAADGSRAPADPETATFRKRSPQLGERLAAFRKKAEPAAETGLSCRLRFHRDLVLYRAPSFTMLRFVVCPCLAK